MVHLTISKRNVAEVDGVEASGSEPIVEKRHFCEDCYDAYNVQTGMNSSRDLVQLSDRYRSKLYDLLEVEHPEVFKGSDEQLHRTSEVMQQFLRDQLKRNNIEINEDGFGMLLKGFIGSAEFYERRDRMRGE